MAWVFGCSLGENHTIPNNFNLICHWSNTLHSFQAVYKLTNIVGPKRDGFKTTTYLFPFPENCKAHTPQMRVCTSWAIIKHLKTFKFTAFNFSKITHFFWVPILDGVCVFVFSCVFFSCFSLLLPSTFLVFVWSLFKVCFLILIRFLMFFEIMYF